MVNIFFGLPSSLSAAILCDWLNLKSVCRLDSAMCARKERNTLLDVLHSVECIGQLQANSNVQLQWMNRKGVCSKLFSTKDSFNNDECHEFFQRSGRFVLMFSQLCLEAGIPLQMATQYCHNLIKIYFTSWNKDIDVTELLCVNPNLVELRLQGETRPFSQTEIVFPNLKRIELFGAFNNDTCSTLVKASSRLCYLSLRYTSVTSAGLIEAARHCPLLRFFQPPDLPDIDDTLQQVTQFWVHIEHICLSFCTSLTNAGITAVSRNVNSLCSIHINYSPNISNTCLLSLAEYQHRTLEIFIIDEMLDVDDETEVVEERKTFNVEAVTAFRAACTRLRDFEWQRTIDDDANCDNASEIVATHLASADRVTTLSVFRLDDAILYAIATHCAQLRALNLEFTQERDVELCTDAALLHMAEKCASLNTIALSDPSQRARLQGLLAANVRVNIIEEFRVLFAHSFGNLYPHQNPLRL